MTILQGISDKPKQQMRVTLPDGSILYMTLEYVAQQLCWMASFQWGTKTIGSRRISPHPNLLNQWRNTALFGLAVVSQNNVEPTELTDLSDGTVAFYLLDSTDLAYISKSILGNG